MLLRKRGAETSSRRCHWTLDETENNEKDLTANKENALLNISPDVMDVRAQMKSDALLDSHVALTDSPVNMTSKLSVSTTPPVNVLDAVDEAMDAAANKLVRKALRFMSLEEDTTPPSRKNNTPSRSPLIHQSSSSSQGNAMATTNTSSPLFRFDSSFFDKGFDAITGVGKFVEDVAVTLDTVIGQAFDDWGSSTASSSPYFSQSRSVPRTATSPTSTVTKNNSSSSNKKYIYNDESNNTSTRHKNEPTSNSSTKSGYEISSYLTDEWASWGEFDGASKEIIGSTPTTQHKNSMNFAHTATTTHSVENNKREIASSSSNVPQSLNTSISRQKATNEEVQQWRRRAQVLQKELQKLKAQRNEYQILKDKYARVEHDLHATSSTLDQLSAENCRLRLDSTPLSLPDGMAIGEDPVAAELVMKQMEALLSEKAALAQENDRLLREKASLHELLQLMMMNHVSESENENELLSSGMVSHGESSSFYDEDLDDGEYDGLD